MTKHNQPADDEYPDLNPQKYRQKTVSEEEKELIKRTMTPYTPITEEALREKGFVNYVSTHPNRFYLSVNGNLIEVNIINMRVSADVQEGFIRLPGCKTMQDIGDLIRLLGGKEG